MKKIVVTLDQLRRPSPGGIATYVRGLLAGLTLLADNNEFDAQLVGLIPRGPTIANLDPRVNLRTLSIGEALSTVLWGYAAAGVPSDADVVHATSMAGPYGGGRTGAVHSVLIHDLLWREYPHLATRRGAKFHEARLQKVVRDERIRALVTSPILVDQLVACGVQPDRVHVVRLGVDDSFAAAQLSSAPVTARVDALVGDDLNFTVAVGTIQPRKNLERLIAAHAVARRRANQLGPLLLVGEQGWGDVDTTGARELGTLDNDTLRALVSRARVVAYVPIDEGWGLPAVEALALGRPLVASNSVPSVADNDEVIRVSALDVEQISDGLVRAVEASDDDGARERRRASVRHLDWATCARDHLVAWS